MKISNETKIGALTLLAVVLLILGFNFLKGKSVFKSGFFLYAKYTDTKGLQNSNAVIVNGFQVGTVYSIKADDKSLSGITVEIKLNDAFQLPKNSVAVIQSNPLGSPKIEITRGNSGYYLKSGDTLVSGQDQGLLGSLSSKLSPAADQLTSALGHLDSLLMNFNTVLNTNNKGSITSILSNLQKTTASFAVTSTYLQTLLNAQSGALAHSLNNMEKFTGNLNTNNGKLNQSVANLQTMTQHLSEADIKGMMNNLNQTVADLRSSIAKISSDNGTLGALINDKGLYNNLNSSVRSMNILLDDLRAHPKRYVSISVFGRKDKGDYLTAPLPTDSTKSSK